MARLRSLAVVATIAGTSLGLVLIGLIVAGWGWSPVRRGAAPQSVQPGEAAAAGSNARAQARLAGPSAARPAVRLGREGRAAVAQEALRRQSTAIRQHRMAAFLGTWDTHVPSARRTATTAYADLAALRVTGYHNHYLGVASSSRGIADRGRLGPGAWTARVRVDWRIRHFDRRDAHVTLRYTFRREGGRMKVADMTAGPKEHLPIWLTGRLVVRRTPRTLAVASNQRDADRLSRQLVQAVGDVGRVLTHWHGDLVGYVPRTDAQMQAVLGALPDSLDGLAAVTSTVDGSRRLRAPVAIVFRPTTYHRLSPLGAHVVVSHESTHVATRVASNRMPRWLGEGFADYVGIGSVPVATSVAAARAIRAVKTNGPPNRLPPDRAFLGGGRSLEATYEEAWLASRLIARRYGQGHLVAFVDAVRRHPGDTDDAFRKILGTTQRAFTADWRRYLTRLAHAR